MNEELINLSTKMPISISPSMYVLGILGWVQRTVKAVDHLEKFGSDDKVHFLGMTCNSTTSYQLLLFYNWCI